VERVTASGGDVGRLNVVGSTEVLLLLHYIIVVFYMLFVLYSWINFSFWIFIQIGPLRCWPGGLCLSRSIGDRDVGEFIVPVPHVKQVKVSFFFHIFKYICTQKN
jgi:hypothetical protein